jgi:hypothetical protein
LFNGLPIHKHIRLNSKLGIVPSSSHDELTTVT